MTTIPNTLPHHQKLDTYSALSSAGILPSETTTYSLQQIQDALTAVTGSSVVLGCEKGKLNQAWYSYNVRGSLQTGDFVPTEPAGKGGRGTCPKTGISYLPKADGGQQVGGVGNGEEL